MSIPAAPTLAVVGRSVGAGTDGLLDVDTAVDALRAVGVHAVPIHDGIGTEPGQAARLERIRHHDAIFLVGVASPEAQATRLALDLRVPVFTEQHARAVALIAGLLVTVRRARLQLRSSRVLVLGAAHGPEIADVAVAAGVAEVVRWNPADGHNFPLSALARRVDVVIDASGCDQHCRDTQTMVLPPPVIALRDPEPIAVALADLVEAVHQAPNPMITLERLLDCAQGEARRALPNRLWPRLTAREADPRAFAEAPLAGTAADAEF